MQLTPSIPPSLSIPFATNSSSDLLLVFFSRDVSAPFIMEVETSIPTSQCDRSYIVSRSVYTLLVVPCSFSPSVGGFRFEPSMRTDPTTSSCCRYSRKSSRFFLSVIPPHPALSTAAMHRSRTNSFWGIPSFGHHGLPSEGCSSFRLFLH